MNSIREFRFGLALFVLVTVPTLAADPPATNRPPNVNMVRPADGQIFPRGTNILLGANAPDDGRVLTLEFFAGENKIGDAYGPLTTPMGAWLLTWTNPPPGTYLVTARATDDLGTMATSPPVRVAVVSGPPRISITAFSKDGASLFIQGQATWTNVIEASTDLVIWTPISTNLMPATLCPICPYILFRDAASTNLARRFYRSFEIPHWH